MKPLVTVVLCSYNQAAYLPMAIDSVLGQTYPRWELIIVDNGSTDGTRELLERRAGELPPSVRLMLHADNVAPTIRLNQALSQARGEYASILYSDDYYLPRKLERQVACFETLPPDYGVVYGPGLRLYQRTGQRSLDRSVSASGQVLRDLLLRRNEGFVVAIAPMFKRACWERYPFYEDIFFEGEMVYLRYALRHHFQYLDEPLVVMRDHEQNHGKQVLANVERMLVLVDRLAQDPEFPLHYRPYVQAYKGGLLRDMGWMGLRVYQDPVLARGMLARALRHDPRVLLSPRVLGGALLSLLPRTTLGQANRLADTLAELRRWLSQIEPPAAAETRAAALPQQRSAAPGSAAAPL